MALFGCDTRSPPERAGTRSRHIISAVFLGQFGITLRYRQAYHLPILATQIQVIYLLQK
ncbi:hypothetical protein [Nostoc sp.]|uniref:hypothetical protein n=1 Tax=Nostoc sp. TaxID=1180 RepID=UPI002FF9726A